MDHYEFWLQNQQMLDPVKNLVEQCVQVIKPGLSVDGMLSFFDALVGRLVPNAFVKSNKKKCLQ